MMKPNIGKKLLPLLDVIFILLALFLVLPQGIITREATTIQQLKQQSQELENRLNYYRWRYGEAEKLSGKNYHVQEVEVRNNQVFYHSTELNKQKLFSQLKEVLLSQRVTFVIIRIKDIQGPATTNQTVDQVREALQKLGIVHIVTYN